MKTFLAVVVTAIFICGCAKETPQTFERTEKIMGTLVTLKASGRNSKAAVDTSFEQLFTFVENIKTDVNKLNDNAGNGKFIKISSEVFEMLKLSQHYSALSDGAFDVTIGAAVDLWRTARKTKKLPTPEEIDAVRSLVGFKHLHLNETEQSAMLDLAGVKVNLGGVGKGYGVDIVRKVFKEQYIPDGLINFGTSSIFAFGKKRIGLKNPRNDSELSEVVELENAAVSTSGDYEQFFIADGRRLHHIIDPLTCSPTDNGVASVSVIVSGEVENCGAVADILSTTIFVLGEERGKIFCGNLANISVYIQQVSENQ